MFQVLPGLYVGNYRDSKDASQLERFEITHIVAIHDAARKLHSVSRHESVMLISELRREGRAKWYSKEIRTG
jgi:atypical dual specificity phosphatase